MKKILFAIGLAFSVTSVAFASSIDVEQLNSQIKALLTPFQNQTTSAHITFDELNKTKDRVDRFGVHAKFYKQGANNFVSFNLDNLDYDYHDGINPKTSFAGGLGTDLTKLISQEEINQMVPYLVEFLDGMMEEQDSMDYGEALNFNGAITSADKDAEGNYTAFTALFSANVDFGKLPDDENAEEIFFKSIVIGIALDVKKGFQFHGYVVSNPDYDMFKEDQEGLTEFLQKLVANDPNQMEEISEWIEVIDAIATRMLESDMVSKYVTKIHSKR